MAERRNAKKADNTSDGSDSQPKGMHFQKDLVHPPLTSDRNFIIVVSLLVLAVAIGLYSEFGLRGALYKKDVKLDHRWNPVPHADHFHKSFFDFHIRDIQDHDLNLKNYEGKVILAVNVASKCTFTPQYKGLENLYRKYKNRGLVVIGFPCNQFNNQEPLEGSAIQEFCQKTYDVTFPLTEKIEVNGDNEHPIYTFFKHEKAGPDGIKRIKWNFEKFLINREGHVEQRYPSTTDPSLIAKDIEKLL